MKNSNNKLEKSVLVLCDNELLFQVIAVNLKKIHLTVEPWIEECIAPRSKDFDLIIIAFSAPTGEPVVSLFKAALISMIGKVPLLIISDRRFDPVPAGQIFYLEFPFKALELRHTVQNLLIQV